MKVFKLTTINGVEFVEGDRYNYYGELQDRIASGDVLNAESLEMERADFEAMTADEEG